MIACTLKAGALYTPTWVAKLAAALEVFSPGERLVCLTDYDQVPCERISLTKPYKGWWAKMEMFRPGIFPEGEQVVYLDLDVVVTGNLAPLLEIRPDFSGLRDFWDETGINSSVMSFTAGGENTTRIWEMFTADPEHWMQSRRSDQEFITDAVGAETPCLQDLLPNRFVRSYKQDCTSMTEVPEGLAILVTHGHPKATDFAPHYWVRKAWDSPGR